MPGRSLLLHFHTVQLLPSFSDTQSIHNIPISILFPHPEIPSYPIYPASSLLWFLSVCWIEFQFLLTFKNPRHFETVCPFLDFTSCLFSGLLLYVGSFPKSELPEPLPSSYAAKIYEKTTMFKNTQHLELYDTSTPNSQ